MKRASTRVQLALLSILSIAAVMPTVSFGEVPKQINHQGYLTDDAGNPVADDNYAFVFSIYDAATGGLAIWSEMQIVSVVSGIYDVVLGLPGNGIVPADMDGSRWLEMTVEGETLYPRQAITSTAYALKAGDADTIEGLTAAALDARYVNKGQADAVTTDMIVHDAVVSTHIVNNSLTAADLGANAVGASELANNAVDTDAIVNRAVTNAKIYPNAVDSSTIADGSVSAEDLADGATIAEILDDDGDGSGLNADLLDNHEATDFATNSHLHDSRYVNASGDTITGPLTVENTLSVGTDTGNDNDVIYMDSGVAEWLRWENPLTRFQFSDALNVAGGTLAVGSHAVQPAYNSIGTGTPESSNISGASDLYVHDDLESGDDIHAGGDLSISGNLAIGTDDATNNDLIYMDDGGEYFRWDDDLDNDPGNGLDGGFYYSDELEVSGDVTISGSSSEFKYKNPKICYLNIPACAFIKDDFERDTVWSVYFGYAYTANSGTTDSCWAYAPVYLPEGAVVTDVEVRYYDRHAVENVAISFDLKMYLNDTVSQYSMAGGSVTSSGESSTIHFLPDTDGVIGHNPISSDRSYYLSVTWNPTNVTLSPSLRFYGATITYTVDRVGN